MSGMGFDLASRIWLQKDMCSKEIGLYVQNMVTILSSIVNITGGGLYDYAMSMRSFTLKAIKRFTLVPKMMRKVVTALLWSC